MQKAKCELEISPLAHRAIFEVRIKKQQSIRRFEFNEFFNSSQEDQEYFWLLHDSPLTFSLKWTISGIQLTWETLGLTILKDFFVSIQFVGENTKKFFHVPKTTKSNRITSGSPHILHERNSWRENKGNLSCISTKNQHLYSTILSVASGTKQNLPQKNQPKMGQEKQAGSLKYRSGNDFFMLNKTKTTPLILP